MDRSGLQRNFSTLPSSNASHRYDPNTGQTYREWTESNATQAEDGTGWEYKGVEYTAPPLAVSPSSKGPVKGPRSLVEMCTTVIVNNINLLEHDHDLDDVPPHLLLPIWKQLGEDYLLMPLRAFMFLSRATCINQRSTDVETKVPKDVYRYQQVIKELTGPLRTILKPLQNRPSDFIVHLTIGGKGLRFPTHELLLLTDLKNLGVLEIIQPAGLYNGFPARASDNILRGWAEKPFPVLRVLKIWGQDYTTGRSLRYLDKFPALHVYDVSGRLNDWEQWAAPPQWKKLAYESGGSLLKKTTKIIDWLSSSTYADVCKAYSLMRCWEPIGLRPLALPVPDEPLDEVTMVVGEQKAIDIREDMAATKDQMDAFNCFLRNGHNIDEGKRRWWAYMMYCHIGRVTGDMDLVKQGMHDPKQSFLIDSNAIPPRPYIEIALGDINDPQFEDEFEYHCTYVRVGDQPLQKRRAPSAEPDHTRGSGGNSSGSAPPRKLTKKQRFFDMKDL
ncbi:hypothetical protein F5B19DRAFT_321678 [Rostrohypoxylon terebratum]|nr:hypothetical protein F5B19DRAFT_321678 [Rostrohypoxylon terebratum]